VKRWRIELNRQSNKYIFLSEAKKAVAKLNISSRSEYLKRYKEDQRLPSKPERHYINDGWIDFYDFLGTKKKVLLTYSEAQIYAQKKKVKTSEEWRRLYKKSKINNVPNDPENYYKGKGWTTWSDFLSNDNIAIQHKKFISHKQAKKIVRTKKFRNQNDYYNWIRALSIEQLREYGIPKKPSDVYKKNGWKGWRDFLGY